MMLHVTNGDAAGDPLRTHVAGRVILACDVLHEGPAGATADLAAWHRQRAQVLARHPGDVEKICRDLAAADAELAAAGARDETVLWFEHDLFDQLQIARTLTRLPETARVSIICIGEFPGVTPFHGLGQLRGEQLAALLPHREAVTAAHRERAREAWNAFQAADPRALQRIVDDGAAAFDALFPFMRAALRRLLEEYPSTRNGLSRTEHAALASLADSPRRGHDLFVAAQQGEERPFMGDSTFFAIAGRLARAPTPLVAIAAAGVGDLPRAMIEITDAGREVLAGRADHVRLNGIDQWRGGVHILAADNEWRWDAARQTLVSW